jgi:hypothetical protein
MMRTEGNAAQLLDDYLMGLDIDKVLASVGIYRENVRSRGFSPSDRVIVETRFSRPGPRRVDVTTYGDDVQRHIEVGPPGIEVLVDGTSHVDRLTADRERERRYEAMDYADE